MKNKKISTLWKELIENSGEEIVDILYKAVLTRPADSQGVNYWKSVLLQEGINGLLTIINTLINSQEFVINLDNHITYKTRVHPVELYEEPVICFIHITKCAGQSFIKLLRSIFGEEKVTLPFRNLQNFPINMINRFQVIAGHSDYDEIRMFLPRKNILFITFLREPIERLKSLYNFWHAHDLTVFSLFKDNWLLELANTLSPLEFFKHSKIRDILWNEMTFRVMGYRLHKLWKKAMQKLKENEIKEFIEDVVRPAVKIRLNEFLFVGLQEEYDKSVEVFCKILNKEKPKQIVAVNVTSKNIGTFGFKKNVKFPPFTQEVRKEIEKLVQLDRVVYEEGKKVFQKLCQNPESKNLFLNTIYFVKENFNLNNQIEKFSSEKSKLEDKMVSEISNLKHKVTQLEIGLSALINSKPWRVYQKLGKIKRTIFGNFKEDKITKKNIYYKYQKANGVYFSKLFIEKVYEVDRADRRIIAISF